MFQNYEYFLALAETRNISRAAEQLYVSHQCLSRYLKTLEQECGLTLFNRKPALSLTYAGEVMLKAFREVQRIENSTSLALAELKDGSLGTVRLGITEGRLRIFLPDLLKQFGILYPSVTLQAVGAPTAEMIRSLLDNKLDLVLGGSTDQACPGLKYDTILQENMYLIVSDHLLRQYFPDRFPACRQDFAAGADLREFQSMPFSIAAQGYHSRTMVEDLLQASNLSLNIIYEARQPDLLHMLTARNYAASFCLTMYLPNIQALNRSAPADNQLNVFPIRGLTAKNPVFLISQEGRYMPDYTKALIRLIRQQCQDCCAAGEELLQTAAP